MRATRLLFATCLLIAGTAGADPEPLRVGTSGDYPPFSQKKDGSFEGFDIAVARAYAADRGREIEFVAFAWPQLAAAFESKSFDVAMSGITVRPDRSLLGTYSVPVMATGAVILVSDASGADSLEKLDQRGTRIGVNAGGHLERVANATFRLATIVAIPDNAGVLATFGSGNLDAVVTDSVEAPLWQRMVEDSVPIGPITQDRKAYLVASGEEALSRDLDAWLLAREADGQLGAWRREYFAEQGDVGPAPRRTEPTATPLRALVAAMDERLALMPAVAAAKREGVLPIADPAREQKVLDATVAAIHTAAETAGRPAPSDDAVRAFTQAQMDAAKEVQLTAVRDTAFVPPSPLPDLDTELRPALLRIGARIAALVVALPGEVSALDARRTCNEGLRAPWMAGDTRARSCNALVALVAAPRGASAQDGASEKARNQR